MGEADGTVVTDGGALRGGAVVRMLIRVLALAALVGSGVLLYESLAAGAPLPGCGEGSGCDAVLNSAWSRWLGVPVAGPAAAVYLMALAASLHIGPGAPERRRQGAWVVLMVAAVVAAGAAVWFLLVQAAFIGAFCRYCLAVHACGVAMAALVVGAAPLAASRRVALTLGGLVPVAALAAGQWWMPAATTRALTLPGGLEVRFSPEELPHLGDPAAPVVLVSLFDYTCPHCRQMHGHLLEAVEHYEGQLGVVALPVPLDPDCNPAIEWEEPRHAEACDLARLGLAVWRADRSQFAAFDAWLFESEMPRAAEAARAKAVELVGEPALDAALADPWIDEQIAHNVKLYELTDLGRLPQLITGSTLIAGRPETAQELFELLEAETPLRSR